VNVPKIEKQRCAVTAISRVLLRWTPATRQYITP
jgi:hypothetical protein